MVPAEARSKDLFRPLEVIVEDVQVPFYRINGTSTYGYDTSGADSLRNFLRSISIAVFPLAQFGLWSIHSCKRPSGVKPLVSVAGKPMISGYSGNYFKR